ncbi:MAG: hypothetical protein WBM59_06690, partial [Sedimenticolaceae bacterium]
MKGFSHHHDIGLHCWVNERCARTPETHSLTISFTPSVTGLFTVSLQALHLLDSRRFGIIRALFDKHKKIQIGILASTNLSTRFLAVVSKKCIDAVKNNGKTHKHRS